MYEAKVFRLMTGAPFDIKEVINIVRKCINEWNPVNWKIDCYPISGIALQDPIYEVPTRKSDRMICKSLKYIERGMRSSPFIF